MVEYCRQYPRIPHFSRIVSSRLSFFRKASNRLLCALKFLNRGLIFLRRNFLLNLSREPDNSKCATSKPVSAWLSQDGPADVCSSRVIAAAFLNFTMTSSGELSERKKSRLSRTKISLAIVGFWCGTKTTMVEVKNATKRFAKAIFLLILALFNLKASFPNKCGIQHQEL